MMKKKKRFEAIKLIAVVETLVLISTFVLSAFYAHYACQSKRRQLESKIKRYAEREDQWLENWYDYYKEPDENIHYISRDCFEDFFGGLSSTMMVCYKQPQMTPIGTYRKTPCPFGMKYEVFDKNGLKIFDNEEKYTLTLRFDSEDHSEFIYLRCFFTEEQINGIEQIYDGYGELIGVEKVIGYFEDDSFVVAGITLYSVSDNDELNEYEMVNDDLLKKASEKKEVVYDCDYLELCDGKNIEEGATQAELDVENWAYSRGCDYYREIYDEELLKIADEYYQEKAAVMESEDAVSFEYINEGDNIIGYCGVIDFSKFRPDVEGAVKARVSACLDINKYLRGELISRDLIGKYVITFAIMQLLGIIVILAVRSRKKEIRKSKEARNTMINALANEMKIPAEIIAISAGKINEGDGAVVEYNENVICDEAEHISNLVSHMLKHTRKSGAKYELNITATDINAIVRKACSRFKQIAAKRNIIIETDNRESCIIDADTGLLEIVVDNYFSNAIALCDQGGKVRVKVSSVGIEMFYEGKSLSYKEIVDIWRPLKKTGNKKGEALFEVSGLYFSGEILKLHGFTYGFRYTDDGMCLYFSC